MKKHFEKYELKKDLPGLPKGTIFKRIELNLGMRAFYIPEYADYYLVVDNVLFSSDFPVAYDGNAPMPIFAQGNVEHEPKWFKPIKETN